MADCVSGRVTIESSVESTLRRAAAFEQKQQLYGDEQLIYDDEQLYDDKQLYGDVDDVDNINVDSTDTESDADL